MNSPLSQKKSIFGPNASPNRPIERMDLMCTEDIARMLGLSRVHVVSRITKRPDFPAPIVNLSQRLRRWSRAEVEAWVLNSGKRS